MLPDLLTKAAIEYLEGIWSFVAPHNRNAADRLVEELFNACEQLSKWPGKGHIRRDVPRDVRFWPVGSYLIVYREKPFLVIAIVHGGRDIGSVLKSR
ncbi:MAG: hypothetical protein DMG65_24405 [Candidatus Angelobacter sp. Gp1-AA117]|nr:MAG: hypothetical protein DMG65_24405 [Candidatus Angelobacter sp. Gp1-AA117]